MFLSCIWLVRLFRHTHVSKNGAQIHLQTSPNLHVPKNRLDPSTTSARVEKILSLLPVVGLFVAGYLIYQKHTVMKDAYSRLGYTPNEKCPNLTCSKVGAMKSCLKK